MNEYGENPCCYFHAKEVVVGVCSLCLKERLLCLASKQGQLLLSKDVSRSSRRLRNISSIALPKVFALASFLHRSDPAIQNPDNGIKEGSITSLDDSFISINLEGGGSEPWESKRTASIGPSWIPGGGGEELKGGNRMTMMMKSTVEQANRRGSMRWRKRIGQIFHLARWNRSRKAGTSQAGIAGKVESIKGMRECMRNMARTTSTTL